ncbi:Dihydropteroate synthase-like protein [Mycotypha africana]|uniref:Dihydropteroate synthase-like protein n=1 Tax=Mycotypha africana TaxID=64632 RepID=UPI002301EF2A|nr:Dihydropteroate synthase-like protein [Mycotypha africana]KAI8984263.1 Dihydropteroate synthase-like protein [Mycotypha africana]
MSSKHYDKILVKNLVLKNIAGVEAWQRLKHQPVVISVELFTDITAAGNTDHVKNTIHYGHVTKAITTLAESTMFGTLEGLAHAVVKLCCVKFGAAKTTVTVEQPKALLHAAASGVKLTRALEDYKNVNNSIVETTGEISGLGVEDVIFVRDLRLHTIVGVNPWEREEKQVVIINLKVYPSSLPYGKYVLADSERNKAHNLRTVVRTLTRHIEASGYKTIEAFASTVARLTLEKCHVNKISVRVEKPSAILFADCSGIEVTRDRIWLKEVIECEEKEGRKFMHNSGNLNFQKEIPAHYIHTCYIAFGSNIGDRVNNIKKALSMLEADCSSIILDTSYLYETPPMYYTEQPAFLNGACKIATCLTPQELLTKLKEVENNLGRQANFRNGPRPIDLDILFYDDLVLEDDDRLIVPHKSLQEREFVLWPLCDIARDMEHPRLFKTCGQLLSQLLKVNAESEEGPLKIDKVMPIQEGRLWRWNEKTYVMGILNTTPDSFSDGGKHYDISAAIASAWRMKEEGADIIDVGGMSTRPGADDTFPEEEEIKRVVPVITELRAAGFDLPISVDTFRAAVAAAAIKAGANLINDISGGSRDPNMLKVMAECNVPVCLMHMRGDAQTMMSKQNTTYENDDVVDDVSHVLNTLVQRAIAAGVHRYNIIIDPGIGFAKTGQQDFDIIRHLKDISQKQDSLLFGLPCLMGISRKKFIGNITGVKEAEKRTFGTAGAVAACVAGGANIVRVHDVRQMWEVTKVCDAIWRH